MTTNCCPDTTNYRSCAVMQSDGNTAVFLQQTFPTYAYVDYSIIWFFYVSGASSSTTLTCQLIDGADINGQLISE